MMTPKKNQSRKMPKSSPRSENTNPNLIKSTPAKKPIKKSSPAKTPIQKSSKKKQMNEQKPKKNTSLEEPIQCEEVELEGSSKVRKMKTLMLEEAMTSIPEPGAGRVMHLVKAFEKLLLITKDSSGENNTNRENEKKGKVMNWALPGYQKLPIRAEVTAISSSSLFSSPPQFERESSDQHSSVGSNCDRLSWQSSTSDCEKRSHSKSTSSSSRSWNKKLKATSQHPFKLRTEQRGRYKEEQFLTSVKEMFLEEEKQRIPIAQGLPLTTEYPECLVKPFVKESTEPVDLVLHSDVRAQERADFDLYVAERMSLYDHIKLERERLQKLEEEEETRRLRKELVPKAQPMPYFDRPFIPKKSRKPHTVPKEPRIQIRQAKLRGKMRPPYAKVND